MSQKKFKSLPLKARHGRNRSRILWPLALVGGGVALLALAWIALSFATPASKVTPQVSGAPSLKVDQETIDLGERKLGVPVNVSFQLSNVGDRPLRFIAPPYVEIVEGC